MANANQKARARIQATRKDLAQARMGGFKATGSALDAVYGNLATTQKGIGKTQTVANQRALAAVARIASRTSRASARQGVAGQNMFGNVVGSSADRQNASVEAAAKAGRLAIGGNAKATRTQAKGAVDTLGIVKAGAKAAASGAQGQLADALAYRARQDAQVVAQMQQARQQAQLQYQTWVKQQKYLQDHPANQPGQSASGMAAAARGYGDASVAMRDYLVDHPDATVAELVTAASPADQNEQLVYTHLAKALTGPSAPQTREEEIQAVMDSMLTLYPNFQGHAGDIRKAITAQLEMLYTRQALATTDAAANPGNPSNVSSFIQATPSVSDITQSGPFAPGAFDNSSPSQVAQDFATSGPMQPGAFDNSSPLDVWRSFWDARPWAHH